MRVMKWSMIALAVTAGTSQLALASAQDESKGFVEDSTLNLKLRALYMNRDYKHGAGNPTAGSDKGYREDTGLGAQMFYESGFTQGTIGAGVDAMGFGSVRLDGGTGRRSNGLFAADDEGNLEHSQTKGGAAVKFRFSNTVLKYGQQIVASPVFATDDGRLLPEVATGTSITSNEIDNLTLNIGRFTSMSAQTGMGHDSLGLKSADIAGATYAFTKSFTGTVAASDVEDYWKRQYVNLNYTLPIDDLQSLNFDFNAYRTKSQGEDLGGDVDNKIWSTAVAYSLGAHKFTLGYQRSSGDTGYAYGVDGGGTVFLNNSVQYSDFVGAEEKSWQVRYDINMATYGVPGLSFMTRYITGDNIEASNGEEGKEHEWDFETKYVVQQGPIKDMSFRLRSAIYRANNAYDADYGPSNNDLRFIVEYPLSIM